MPWIGFLGPAVRIQRNSLDVAGAIREESWLFYVDKNRGVADKQIERRIGGNARLRSQNRRAEELAKILDVSSAGIQSKKSDTICCGFNT